MLSSSCENLEIRLLGTELDFMLEHLIPLPKVRNWIPRSWRKPWARRWGWSIWATGTKNGVPMSVFLIPDSALANVPPKAAAVVFRIVRKKTIEGRCCAVEFILC